MWIYEQGGPTPILQPGAYDLFRNFPGSRDIRFVQVHQTLTLNNGLAARSGELSLADLQAEVDVSIEILDRTIRHFKAPGKRVVVIGHSYGAFLGARYLWRRGHEAADRYVLMAGRLDMPQIVVDGILNDGVLHWFPNAVDPKPVEFVAQ